MSQYDHPTISPGEQQTGLTTEESYDNIDPNSPDYQGSQKKPSILGKLKDKTKKAGSKIKSKVGKKKNADGTPATPTAGGADEEDEDDEDDSPAPSPADAASPVANTTPYTGPASVPREFGTYPSQDSTPPDMSGLSVNDDKPEQQPSATEKASEASEGAKDAMYGGAAATAGALGYDAMSKDDHPDEKPVTEKASDMSSDAAGQAEEFGRGGYNRAGDAKDEVAEKGSEVADQTKGAAYEAKDAAQSKAVDVNNATDDSQTYTQKATNAATAAKDTAVEKLGLNQPSEGPSMMDKAKGYFGSAVDTTKDKTGTGMDTTKDYAAGAKDSTMGTTGSATDTTKDYAARAQDATTPKQDDKALSEKITDTLSGLTAPANTPTGGAPDEANPGILGKLTGMLGYAQKTPEDRPHPAADTTTSDTQ